jgi:hypothetical protein
VVDLRRSGPSLVATQSRYAFLGTTPPAQSWTIPLCVRVGGDKQCRLLGPQPMTFAVPAGAVVMPNVGGTGYYRFNLEPTDWHALIASSAELAPGEALAATDSLWAAFRAGKAPASWLVEQARAMAANPSSAASADPGERLAGLRLRGLIPTGSEQSYRSLMSAIYAPRLAAIGFDPAWGAHSADAPDRQKLRQQLVNLLAFEARDAAVRAKLKAAAEKYLAGDKHALDPGFQGSGLAVLSTDGGLPVARKLVDLALSSEDPTLRQAALVAAAANGHADVANYLLSLSDKRLRSFDRITLIFVLAATAETRDLTADWIFRNYARLAASGNGIFMTSRLPSALNAQCGVPQSERIQKVLGPAVAKADTGLLQFQRTVEQVRDCGILKQAKQAEIAAALSAK